MMDKEEIRAKVNEAFQKSIYGNIVTNIALVYR